MSGPPHAAQAVGRPTRTRYGVVAILVALAMVTYLDRACIGTLAPWISADLGLSKEQMGWVFSAFAVAYAAFEIPTAAWADRRGTRLVLTRIVVWWSSFTIATAAAIGHWSLLVIRFLFGVGRGRGLAHRRRAASRAGSPVANGAPCRGSSLPAPIWRADSRRRWCCSCWTI